MKYDEVKRLNRKALSVWGDKQHGETEEQLRKRKFYWKLKECGNVFVKNTSLTMYKILHKRCRSALCCCCSRKWSVSVANALVNTIPNAKHRDMKFMTVLIGITSNIEDIYPMFNGYKKAFQETVYRFRRRKKPKMRFWRSFGLAASLEIDGFMSEEFQFLGDQKQKQYLKMGYDPSATPDGTPIWIATMHGAVYKGRCTLKDLYAVASQNAYFVHIKALDEKQNLQSAIRRMLRYSSKVRYTTTLAKNTRRIWSVDQIRALGGIIYREKGRQSYRFVMKVKR